MRREGLSLADASQTFGACGRRTTATEAWHVDPPERAAPKPAAFIPTAAGAATRGEPAGLTPEASGKAGRGGHAGGDASRPGAPLRVRVSSSTIATGFVVR